MSLKEIIKLVLGWRLLVVLIALPAISLLPARDRFTSLAEKPAVSDLFSMWSNFDGLRYLNISQFGYSYQHMSDTDYAYFPVYPWLIKSLNFFNSYLASGLLVSHLLFILALFILYRLVSLDFQAKVARSTIYLTLLFPTAFFFGSVYPESLFLLLTVLTFYLVRQKYFLGACLTATLASATKITGVFLWPVLIYEFWLVYGARLKNFLRPSTVWLLLPPLGLLSFMRFQFLKTGDPLFFFRIQTTLAGRSLDKLVLLHQIFFRYFKMLIFTDHLDPLFFTVVLELLSATLILLFLILAFKKLRFSYWLFTALSFLLPSFFGDFVSFPRFILVLFPVFIYLSLWLERQHLFIKYLYYSLCLVGSVLAIVFFTRGYFVA